MLAIGDKIPTDIVIKDIDDKDVTLKDFLGNYLVIYFYPKDDTPGCTTEACEFRDYNSEIKKLGAEIIGISKDNKRSHDKFKDKYKLTFTLLSDPTHELMEAFGSWQQKTFMGKKYMGTQRSTFLVNPKGEVIKVWPEVKPENHAKDVYESLKELIK